jgi:exopolyphosphatase / guanosine-5'-triphosphate,3'-diphosphate pyrophosphatase
MSSIIPHWEFRTFGEQFGAAEAAVAAIPRQGDVQESDEVYFLARDGVPSADAVKVRNELLDVKTLREVSADGLERWEPTMKARFPLTKFDIERVSYALHLPRPAAPRDDYTHDQFIDQIVTPGGAVRAVDVHKRRVRFVIDGCSAELTDITVDGRATRTIAIESEDPTAVAAVIRGVGLEAYLNTNYPRGLASLLDGLPASYAVIDIGTNSVKFHVGEHRVGHSWQTVVDRAVVTRLGEGLEGGRIAPQALERTIVAIRGMVDEAYRSGALAIAAVGTAALRAASDREGVLDAIRAGTGLTVEVVSGEEEGRLAYLTTQAGLGLASDRMVVFDTGGGSTQFTFGHGGGIDERFSVPVGAEHYTEDFGMARAIPPAVLDDARAAIAADLARIDDRPVPDALVAMGGAVTNMAAVRHGLAVYDPAVVQDTLLDLAEIDRQIELYRACDAADRRAIVGLQPDRAEVILAGACIVRTVMHKLGQTSLTVSDRGLRHGLLVERFGG